jgi:hypothetical protein
MILKLYMIALNQIVRRIKHMDIFGRRDRFVSTILVSNPCFEAFVSTNLTSRHVETVTFDWARRKIICKQRN